MHFVLKLMHSVLKMMNSVFKMMRSASNCAGAKELFLLFLNTITIGSIILTQVSIVYRKLIGFTLKLIDVMLQMIELLLKVIELLLKVIEFLLKVIDRLLKVIEFLLKLIEFLLKVIDLLLKVIEFLLKLIEFLLKVIDFADHADDHTPPLLYKARAQVGAEARCCDRGNVPDPLRPTGLLVLQPLSRCAGYAIHDVVHGAAGGGHAGARLCATLGGVLRIRLAAQHAR